MTETVLCVDIGTTSLKAGLITAAGEVVSFSKYTLKFCNQRFVAGKWLEGLRSCIKKISEKIKKEQFVIKAVSVSGNGPTIVSDSGMTLLWNEEYYVDRRRTEASLFLPRLIAFKELFPKEYNSTEHLFSGPEFLIYKLTGNPVTVLPEARFLPAYWSEQDLLSKDVNIDPGKLPLMKSIGENLGYISDDIISFLKMDDLIAGKIPVYSCGPDFTAALVGTNTLQPGKLCDRSGSSEGFNFCIDKFAPGENLRLLPSVIPGLWNISALITNSSKLSEKKRLLKIKEAVDLLKKYAEDNKIDFPSEIWATGGQTKNVQWMNNKAKALKMKLMVCECSDSELLGDACAAWFGLGKFKSLQDAAENIVRVSRKYENL